MQLVHHMDVCSGFINFLLPINRTPWYHFFLMYLKNTSLIKKEIQLCLESEVLCHAVLVKH